MKKIPAWSKVLMVIGGYVLAGVLAIGVVRANNFLFHRADANASAGMYAFGDVLFGVSLFCFFCCFPTALAFYFLWQRRRPPQS